MVDALRGGGKAEGEQHDHGRGEPAEPPQRPAVDRRRLRRREDRDGDLDEDRSAAVEDDVTKVPETARHEPLDDLIENADEDSNQGAGDENRLVLDAGSQGLEKQHAENPVLEEVDRLLGLSHEAPCPDDQDGGDPEQQCGIFDVETPSTTAEEDESSRTQRNHHEDHAYADELGWPSRHEVLSEAEDERDRGKDHYDPCNNSEPAKEGLSAHRRHGTRGRSVTATQSLLCYDESRIAWRHS